MLLVPMVNEVFGVELEESDGGFVTPTVQAVYLHQSIDTKTSLQMMYLIRYV